MPHGSRPPFNEDETALMLACFNHSIAELQGQGEKIEKWVVLERVNFNLTNSLPLERRKNKVQIQRKLRYLCKNSAQYQNVFEIGTKALTIPPKGGLKKRLELGYSTLKLRCNPRTNDRPNEDGYIPDIGEEKSSHAEVSTF